MKLRRTVLLWSLAWVALISGLHAWLNLGSFRKAASTRKTLKVGFLPVT